MNKKLEDYIYFKTDNGILYNSSCLDILPLLSDNSIDMVITSPPYNVGISYDTWNDNMTEEDYFIFVNKWISELKRLVKLGGRLGINIPVMGNNSEIKKSDKLVFYLDKYIKSIENNKFNFRECITWIKSNAEFDDNNFSGNNTAWGSFNSPSNPFCRSFSEFILIAHNELPKLQHKGETDIIKEEFMKWTRNVWFMPTDTNKQHPAVFNEELPKRLMKLYTYIGDTILDPFMGSGTSALVAEKNNRRWIGIECSKKYCQLIKNRVETYTNQLRMF
jgi:site-specific DNA-methyltransferase (adenine-specific)